MDGHLRNQDALKNAWGSRFEQSQNTGGFMGHPRFPRNHSSLTQICPLHHITCPNRVYAKTPGGPGTAIWAKGKMGCGTVGCEEDHLRLAKLVSTTWDPKNTDSGATTSPWDMTRRFMTFSFSSSSAGSSTLALGPMKSSNQAINRTGCSPKSSLSWS